MRVKIKKLKPNAIIPKYAKSGDAGLDLVAVSEEWNYEQTIVTYGTGLAVEIPEGYVGLLFPRSSVYKTTLQLSNSVGVSFNKLSPSVTSCVSKFIIKSSMCITLLFSSDTSAFFPNL